MNPVRMLRRFGQMLPRFLKDRRGSADLNTYLLLTAAGCTMVGLTAPHLFNSSKTASDTFEKQVEILQRGSSGGVGGGSGGSQAGDWNLGGQGGLGQLANTLGGASGKLSSTAGQLGGGASGAPNSAAGVPSVTNTSGGSSSAGKGSGKGTAAHATATAKK